MSHFFLKPFFVDGSDLFQKDHGILGQPHLLSVNVNMGGQAALGEAAGDGGRDHRRAVLVSDVVLNDENRAQSALLGSNHGAQIGIINVSASYVQNSHTPYKKITTLLLPSDA